MERSFFSQVPYSCGLKCAFKYELMPAINEGTSPVPVFQSKAMAEDIKSTIHRGGNTFHLWVNVQGE